MDRRTPFGLAGQNSFQSFAPMDPMYQQYGQMGQGMGVGQPAYAYNPQVMNGQDQKLRSLMGDYEQLRGDVNQMQMQSTPASGTRRPYSRELDLMNLLLIGSMDRSKNRSGLEGLGGLLGGEGGMQMPGERQISPFSQGNVQQSQAYNPMMQNQMMQNPMLNNPMMQQNNIPYMQNPYAMQPQMMQQMAPYPMMQQSMVQQPMMNDYMSMQNAASPPTYPYGQNQGGTRQNSQLLVNGQIGVNVDSYNQNQMGSMPNSGQDRITQHIERQNQVLAQLAQNLTGNRNQEVDKERQLLQRRIKELEALNSQDQNYQDLYDKDLEYPQHKRVNSFQYGLPRPKMNYYPPPPSIFQAQQPPRPQIQPQQSKAEKLQMMLLLKQLRNEMKNKSSSRRKNDPEEFINDISFEEQSSEEEDDQEEEQQTQRQVVPRKMMARPVTRPELYDPYQAEEVLYSIDQSQRGMFNLRVHFWAVAYLFWYKSFLKAYITKKREVSLQDYPEMIKLFVQSTSQWILRVDKKALDEIVKTPKLNLQIVPINNKKLSAKEITNNAAKLMPIVKSVIDGIVDNSDEAELGLEMVQFLAKICKNREWLPQTFFSRFEIQRMNFSYHGGIDAMNLNKSQMFLCTNVWIRVLLLRIFNAPWIHVQGTKVTDQMVLNAKTICSVIYEIVMNFVRGQAAIQKDNQKSIPVDYQVKERKDPLLKIDGFEPTQEEINKVQERIKAGDEPLLFPLYTLNDMAPLFDNNRKWVNDMTALIDGWTQKLYKIVIDFQIEDREEELKEMQEAKKNEKKVFITRIAGASSRYTKRKEYYNSLCKEISDLENSIKEKVQNANREQELFMQKQAQMEQQNIQQIRQRQGYY